MFIRTARLLGSSSCRAQLTYGISFFENPLLLLEPTHGPVIKVPPLCRWTEGSSSSPELTDSLRWPTGWIQFSCASCFVGHTVLLWFHAWQRRGKEKEKKHNFAAGIGCLTVVPLGALPYLRGNWTQEHLHFKGTTVCSRVLELNKHDSGPVACGQLGEMGFCWVDSKHLMSARHFPLQLELQHMAFVSAKPRGSMSSTQPSCALTTGMAALICSDTWYTVRTWMESIIACPHIWLRIHLAIALLTEVPFIWL